MIRQHSQGLLAIGCFLSGCSPDVVSQSPSLATYECEIFVEHWQAIDEIESAAGQLGYQFSSSAITRGGNGTIVLIKRGGLDVHFVVANDANQVLVVTTSELRSKRYAVDSSVEVLRKLPRWECALVDDDFPEVRTSNFNRNPNLQLASATPLNKAGYWLDAIDVDRS